jgi:hypothetical protein
MATAVTGVVRGKTIALDEPVPRLDGQRVRVMLEQMPSRDSDLPVNEQSHLLREWAQSGPQGPLDADEAWPDES